MTHSDSSASPHKSSFHSYSHKSQLAFVVDQPRVEFVYKVDKTALLLIKKPPKTQKRHKGFDLSLPALPPVHTFVQPVGEPVENDSFHPRGGDSQRVTPHVRLVVDVILKDVDLKRQKDANLTCFSYINLLIFAFAGANRKLHLH